MLIVLSFLSSPYHVLFFKQKSQVFVYVESKLQELIKTCHPCEV